VTGAGTYTTPTGYLPAAAGIYQWVASYSGDAFNLPVAGNRGDEPEFVLKTVGGHQGGVFISTLASESAGGVVGSAVLSDSAILSGGFQPGGSITFTLTQPDATTITVGTVTVAGDGTYASTTVLATQV